MNITLNGTQYQLTEKATLSRLIQNLNLQGKRYAVEVNQYIVPRSAHAEFILQADDQVEIVHAVGGG